jgi:hypothetical protein
VHVVYFYVAHFLQGHVRFFARFVIRILLCNLAHPLKVFLLGFISVVFLVFNILDFWYFLCCYGRFADKINVFEVRMVEDCGTDSRLELFFALDLFEH